MALRRLTPSDAAEYRALALEGYAQEPEAFTATREERAHLPLSFWEERLRTGDDAPSVVFGAFDQGRLLGVAGLTFEQRPKTRHKATLFGMYVAPAGRGKGFGRALVEACVAYASTRAGIRVINLTVTEGNVAAQRLYERCGFVAFGVEPYAMATDEGFAGKVHMWRAVPSEVSPR